MYNWLEPDSTILLAQTILVRVDGGESVEAYVSEGNMTTPRYTTTHRVSTSQQDTCVTLCYAILIVR